MVEMVFGVKLKGIPIWLCYIEYDFGLMNFQHETAIIRSLRISFKCMDGVLIKKKLNLFF